MKILTWNFLCVDSKSRYWVWVHLAMVGRQVINPLIFCPFFCGQLSFFTVWANQVSFFTVWTNSWPRISSGKLQMRLSNGLVLSQYNGRKPVFQWDRSWRRICQNLRGKPDTGMYLIHYEIKLWISKTLKTKSNI